MKIAQLLFRATLGLVSIAGAVVVHSGAADAQEPFAAQVKSAGLTTAQARTLQARIDALLAAEGGTQIGANRVRWADGSGDTTVPLPGEARARTLGVGAQAELCDYGYLCLFQYQWFGGDRRMLYFCEDHSTPYSFNSYINNQTYGTRAVFKSVFKAPIHITDGAPSSKVWFDGSTTYYIKAC
ncbi:hypothetical protein [Virgisporangium aurantiacum]|uniref:Peptidase inhibitor family I36 n=1 Tax=Virgisporangium aurantiacum TaxID=175570 RepID=A0A8J3Z565_9ACTN|nr:hypothetical protein [Virgisporangium aurantiacum]GIJ57077.1 hypothetical protein Vau01_045930 [Virgisporangium aurantiacum]